MNPIALDKDLLIARGLFYFALAEYTNAEKDLDAVLVIDSSSVKGIFLKPGSLKIRKTMAAPLNCTLT